MIPELIDSFERSLAFMRGLVADLPEKEMFLQPAGVPNHAAWTLGHVIYSCQAIAGELGVEPWLPNDWQSVFGSGSSPDAASTSRHSGKPALLATLADASDRLRVALTATNEAKLGTPLPDEKAREILPTLGHALLQIVAGHTAYHAGQLAVWRRAIGRAPVGVFL
jgi:uncharacterized damage-inducible protein DinB